MIYLFSFAIGREGKRIMKYFFEVFFFQKKIQNFSKVVGVVDIRVYS